MSLEKEIKSVPGFTESRLNSLYSNFDDLKLLNPEGYEANISAWRKLLVEFLRKNYLASSIYIPTTNPNLLHKLSITKYEAPRSLTTVIRELLNSNELIEVKQYLTASEAYPDIFKKPRLMDYVYPSNWMKWTLNYINKHEPVATSSGDLVPANYIYWDHLVEIANSIMDSVVKQINNKKRPTSYSDFLFGEKEFKEFLEVKFNQLLKPLEFEVLLKYYERDVKRIITRRNEEGTMLIKIPEITPQSFTREIENDDFGILSIKISIKQIENRNHELSSKIKDINIKIKGLIKDNKVIAEEDKQELKTLITMRKIFQKSLITSKSSLEQLTKLMESIDQAVSNASVINQIQDSTKILSSLNHSMEKLKIDEILSDMESEISMTKQISDEIYSINNNEIDNDEVDEEYDKLLQEISDNDKVEIIKEKDQANNKSSQDEKDKLIEKLNNLNINSEVKPENEFERKEEKDLEPSLA